jgi:hypothetical protein
VALAKWHTVCERQDSINNSEGRKTMSTTRRTMNVRIHGSGLPQQWQFKNADTGERLRVADFQISADLHKSKVTLLLWHTEIDVVTKAEVSIVSRHRWYRIVTAWLRRHIWKRKRGVL